MWCLLTRISWLLDILEKDNEIVLELYFSCRDDLSPNFWLIGYYRILKKELY